MPLRNLLSLSVDFYVSHVLTRGASQFLALLSCGEDLVVSKAQRETACCYIQLLLLGAFNFHFIPRQRFLQGKRTGNRILLRKGYYSVRRYPVEEADLAFGAFLL